MNILLATSSAIPSGGGVASYNEELLHLFQSSNDLYLITSANERDVQGYKQTISTFDQNWKSYEYSEYILNQIKEWKIDVIINSDSSLMAILAPFVKTPILSVSHFIDGNCALKAAYNSEYINSIVSLSYYGKKYIEKKFCIKEKNKVKVVYNFVADKELPDPSYKLKNKPLTIVYPGGTSIKKSVDVVMRTLYRMLRSDLNFKFIWLGQTKLPLANISPHKHITQFFSNDDRLVITGKISREDAVHYMEETNIFLLPSRGEGCPMTLLEAMRGGCIPIVSDAKHGSREILEMGHFGFIIKQDDDMSLFNVLKNIIQNHNKYVDNYFSTYSFSRTHLSQEIWKNHMSNIIERLPKEKKCIDYSVANFKKSVRGFDKLFNSNRRLEKMQSLICRLYFEYLYYFVK